jgi:DNA-binding LytR/AlgR family response regulator
MKVVVIEDEAVAARKLTRMLEALSIEVIQHIKSKKQFYEFLELEVKPDAYFIDIHLSDGVVFDVLDAHEIEAPIIFTTAYDQYAIKAFKQNSIDYLMKPVDADELSAAINKLKRQTNQSVDLSILSELIKAKSGVAKKIRERISVRVGDRIKSIKIEEIHFFYSSDKVNYLYNVEGRSYPIEQTLEIIQDELEESKFFRVSRSYIICIDHIKDIVSYSNSRLKVVMENADKHEIIVSRDRVKGFKEWLG